MKRTSNRAQFYRRKESQEACTRAVTCLVTITKEDNKLMGQAAGQSKSEMIPHSDTTFFVIRFAMKSGNQNLSAKRLNAPAAAEQLTQFAGDYYSPELGTSYTLVVKDGKLVAQHRRHDDIQLTELDGDLFSGNRWFFQTVQFTRDSENRITGFRLTSGRVRNLRFDGSETVGWPRRATPTKLPHYEFPSRFCRGGPPWPPQRSVRTLCRSDRKEQ